MLIDIKQTYIKEYFVQVPFVVMSTMFQAVDRRYSEDLKELMAKESAAPKPGKMNELKAEIESYLTNEEKPSDLIIAGYAGRLINKFKRLAGCVDEDNPLQIDKSEDVEDLLLVYGPQEDAHDESRFFLEVAFLRMLLEYSKWCWQQMSEEYRAKIDSIIPSFEDYAKIFDYFLNGLDSTGIKVGEQRPILTEWLKFSLQLNVDDVTTRNNLTNLLFRFIGETHHSFKDYEHLLKHGR